MFKIKKKNDYINNRNDGRVKVLHGYSDSSGYDSSGVLYSIRVYYYKINNLLINYAHTSYWQLWGIDKNIYFPTSYSLKPIILITFERIIIRTYDDTDENIGILLDYSKVYTGHFTPTNFLGDTYVESGGLAFLAIGE